MKSKLSTKDLIAAGAFGAIYLVLITVLSSVLSIVPVLFIATPLIAGVVIGTVYMLYVSKVPRRGAILVLAVLVGLLTSTATIYPLILSVLWGLLAELVAARGGRKSANALALSYCVFNLTSVGPFCAIILAKEPFLESCALYYGEEYAAALDAVTPSWIAIVLVAFALVGGFAGGQFGKRVLKKHFEKAGITA